MPRIFISYRRSDNAYVPHFLRDRLAERFGPDAVFIDVDSIPLGADFVDYIGEQVGCCDILLAMIGDGWLDAAFADGPKEGQRRLDDPDDFVRIEIASALARKIPVVPVLMDAATMPAESELPDDLQPLARRQAAQVRPGSDFKHHVDRLIRGIEQLAPARAEPGPVPVAADVAATVAPAAVAPAPVAPPAPQQDKVTSAGAAAVPPDVAPPSEPPELLSFPFTAEQARDYQQRWAESLGIPVEVKNPLGMTFVFIPPGTFLMGSPEGETGRENDEFQHRRTVEVGFYMAVTPVTQGVWKAVMRSEPSLHRGQTRPVENVDFSDCQLFVRRLSEREGKSYSLPTEAQWEYACRAGTLTPFWFGQVISAELANYNCEHAYGSGPTTKCRGNTTPVGSFLPNAWGLYDMHGNVREWCDSGYGSYPGGELVPVKVAASWKKRIVRGGHWRAEPVHCRSAFRQPIETHNRHANGLRPVLAVGSPS